MIWLVVVLVLGCVAGLSAALLAPASVSTVLLWVVLALLVVPLGQWGRRVVWRREG